MLVGLLVSYAVDDLVSYERPRLVARRVLAWSLSHPDQIPTDDDIFRDEDEDDDRMGTAIPTYEEWGMRGDELAANDAALAMAGFPTELPAL